MEIINRRPRMASLTRKLRRENKTVGLVPTYKMVDTCAAEFEAQTPYFYSCYDEETEGMTVK